MILRLPYQPVALDPTKPVPPSLPVGSKVRWRPLVRVLIIGPGTGRYKKFDKALVDSGADDTLFPIGTDRILGVRLRPETGHGHRWRGNWCPLRFGDVELELTDDLSFMRWPAIVGFSPAPMPYPFLGHCGCIQFLDAKFLDSDRVVEFEPNRLFRGTVR